MRGKQNLLRETIIGGLFVENVKIKICLFKRNQIRQEVKVSYFNGSALL